MSDVTVKGRGTTLWVWDTITVPLTPAWKQVSQVYNLTGGELGREDGEDADSFLDSADVSSDFRKRGSGMKVLGDIEFEAAWEVTQTSTKNHKLLFTMYGEGTETYWKIKYANADETGEIYHAFVQSLGEKNIEPDQTIRLPVVLRPTGQYHTVANEIDAVELPE